MRIRACKEQGGSGTWNPWWLLLFHSFFLYESHIISPLHFEPGSSSVDCHRRNTEQPKGPLAISFPIPNTPTTNMTESVPKTQKVALLEDPKPNARVRMVEDAPVLEPGADEVLVKALASGVCHSDLMGRFD